MPRRAGGVGESAPELAVGPARSSTSSRDLSVSHGTAMARGNIYTCDAGLHVEGSEICEVTSLKIDVDAWVLGHVVVGPPVDLVL